MCESFGTADSRSFPFKNENTVTNKVNKVMVLTAPHEPSPFENANMGPSAPTPVVLLVKSVHFSILHNMVAQFATKMRFVTVNRSKAYLSTEEFLEIYPK